MRLLHTYGILLVLFQLTGCFNDSIYKKDESSPEFLPREYYRKHISLSEAGVSTASSLAEQMKREIKKDKFIKRAVVVKKEGKYVVAIQMKSYHYKKADLLSKKYKQTWEEQWKIPIEITFNPEEYRKVERELATKK
ncbi:hypothetical protein ABE65_014580 [Fictibacillus phosphorivorans]|uniref:Sporulation protein n=1 Tax=Fictibacillus phosphorivorans TaxID=1221500 RepID=A0A160INY4_9BACL|nr:hypothetical protein [Fictibacillus phosphorivorans]ANC77954.1 hypothetical protein ABE65_014580 [Fictibacillus phosphorivorans]